MSSLLPLIVLIPLLGALVPGLFAGFGRTAIVWVTALVAVLAMVTLALAAPGVFRDEVLIAGWPWVPRLGLSVSFRLDGLGLLFAMLILGIGLLVIVYARYYLPKRDSLVRLYRLLLLFMAAMLGIVLSENLLLLLVFWELTSLTSFLLVGYWSERADARQGARVALIVTASGGLALAAGILLLGHMAGSFELSAVLQSREKVQGHAYFLPSMLLILTGAFTKSAQFPFHFWLPRAMAAPTPVSAYLHSATMVKAGVFLLARLFPVYSGNELWFEVVGGIGLFTLIYGAYVALFQHDLKGLLAYSTISHLGLITLLFGLGTPLGAVAGIFHIINHAIFKASLFMAAGIIDHEAGTRDMRRLNGLWRNMPHTASLAMVAAASMAGVPLLNGFLSKEMFFAETVHHEWLGPWDWVLPVGATVAGVLAVAYSVRFIHDVFFNGEPVNLPRVPHEPPRWMKIPVEILVAMCLLIGIFPASTVGPFLAHAARGALGGPLPAYNLDVWHAAGWPPVMSAIAFAGGLVLYASRHKLFRFRGVPAPGDLFLRFIQALALGCRRLSHVLENGSLQRYLAILLALTLIVTAGISGPLFMKARPTVSFDFDLLTIVATIILVSGAAGAVLFHRHYLKALVAVGAAGLGMSLMFMRLAAPDLALTQVAVEVVSIVLLLLALYFLPQSAPIEPGRARRGGHAALAILAGSAMAVLAWASMAHRPSHPVSDYFLAHSKTEAGGNNVVNVILVDFRAFDTLGEMTVLIIAVVGILAMLTGLRLRGPDADAGGRPWSGERHPPMMAKVSRPLLPLALAVAVFLFLRGHNSPGGGFVAGLVAGTAFTLQYLANGVRWTEGRLPLDFAAVAAAGLAVALSTGVISMVLGRPFLTSGFGHWRVPLVGEVEWASALVFDLGVFFAVLGVVLVILGRLGKTSHSFAGKD